MERVEGSSLGAVPAVTGDTRRGHLPGTKRQKSQRADAPKAQLSLVLV